jgi:hypothetical protein
MPHPPIRCFLLEPLARRRQWLMRRSHAGEPCSSRNAEHRAKVEIEQSEFPIPTPPRPAAPEWTRFRDDPRWPAHCERCGYAFAENDERLVFFRRIYRDEGKLEQTLDDARPGAMWDAWWLGPEFRGRDGFHLAVMTPGGSWYVDGRSPMTRLHWARIGQPPRVSVQPSIFIPGRYHGWLDDGFLFEC